MKKDQMKLTKEKAERLLKPISRSLKELRGGIKFINELIIGLRTLRELYDVAHTISPAKTKRKVKMLTIEQFFFRVGGLKKISRAYCKTYSLGFSYPDAINICKQLVNQGLGKSVEDGRYCMYYGHRDNLEETTMTLEPLSVQHIARGADSLIADDTVVIDGERVLVTCPAQIYFPKYETFALLKKEGLDSTSCLELVSHSRDNIYSLMKELDINTYRMSLFRNRHITVTGLNTDIVTKPDYAAAWDHIVIPETIRREFQKQVQLIKNYAVLKDRVSLRRGILLSGSPGTGKTSIVKAFLADIKDQVTIIQVSSVGQIKDIYDLAQRLSPSIVILEDIDTIASQREFQKSTIGEVLTVLDGGFAYNDVLTIATTNRPELLDEAIAFRPGRFDTHIKIAPPQYEDKIRIYTLYFKRYFNKEPELYPKIKKFLKDEITMTGAHIKELVKSAYADSVICGLEVTENLLTSQFERVRGVINSEEQEKRSMYFNKRDEENTL